MRKQKDKSTARLGRKPLRKVERGRTVEISKDEEFLFMVRHLPRLYVSLLKFPLQRTVAHLLEKHNVDFSFTEALEMSAWYRVLADEILANETGGRISVGKPIKLSKGRA